MSLSPSKLIIAGMMMLSSGVAVLFIFAAIALGGEGTPVRAMFDGLSPGAQGFVNFVMLSLCTVLGLGGLATLLIGLLLKASRAGKS